MKTGFVVVGPNGRITTDGFKHGSEVESCRAASIIEMEWAIANLQAGIRTAEMPPYDKQTCSADLPDKVMTLLRRSQWLTQ